MRRRRQSGVVDARTLIAGSGDLQIGAFARRQRIRQLLIAGAGVGLIVVAAVLYWSIQGADAAPLVGRAPAIVKCTACDARQTLHLDSRAALPLECPKCHARAARPLWACRACGGEFISKEGQEVVQCPACNSVEVGTAALKPPAVAGTSPEPAAPR